MRKVFGLLALGAIALATACSDSNGPNISPQFSRQTTFPALKSTLQGLPTTGAARVEIGLPATGMVAREVSIENPDRTGKPERVRSRITALATSGDKVTLTLEPGFHVTFSSTTTTFEGDSDLTFQQFVDRVNAALGETPQVLLGVTAERSPTSPLALGPSDSFPATRLVLRGRTGGGGPRLHLNVTQANAVDANSGDCTMAALGVAPTGCLKVLGVTVGIGPNTDLDEMNAGVVKAEFEGTVDCSKAIDTTFAPDGSFFLKDGTQIVVSHDAASDGEAEDRDEHMSLAQVAKACGATPAPTIEVEGEGVVTSAAGSPTVIQATEVRFESEQEEGEVEVELSGMIATITAPNFTVAGRTVVTDGNTDFERADVKITFGDLKVNDNVEVRGLLQSSGDVLAREVRVRVTP